LSDKRKKMVREKMPGYRVEFTRVRFFKRPFIMDARRQFGGLSKKNKGIVSMRPIGFFPLTKQTIEFVAMGNLVAADPPQIIIDTTLEPLELLDFCRCILASVETGGISSVNVQCGGGEKICIRGI
jgi:hypothetical protein